MTSIITTVYDFTKIYSSESITFNCHFNNEESAFHFIDVGWNIIDVKAFAELICFKTKL